MLKNGWIDISVTISSGMMHWPGDPAVKISATQDMTKGDPDNVSHLSLGSHTGTHMDAPRHFFARGKGLDLMPLQATIGAARVIGIRDKQCITCEELRRYRIQKGERVLFKTRNSALWKKRVFQKDFVYILQTAAEYLAARKVRTVGVDYLSVGGYGIDGAATHRTLLGAGIWIIEGLDLAGVLPGKYDLICLPLRILNSDGAPARAVVRRRARE